ncbi:ribonuclease G [Cytobacillus eiseniae]|uniref:Ribonuclease G n=1 Tax=Cytobacillus eiseniae TaxID=762947 RepID=A0ABS4RCF9_9BACI|nr:Rne/Rng family ribonuclease [Cytobacillus eiseniae]MBP2240576.1 ribonuclease G [Cytobacillus eiseniae]
MKSIIINNTTREQRYAVLHDQTVETLVINQPKQHSTVGNIYLGIVEKVLPGMNAAFVDIGEGKSGYLHRDKLASFLASNEEKEVKASRSISSYVHQGERILVQVEKDATGTKGPKLTGVIELQGNYLIYMPSGRYVAISKKIENNQMREKWRQWGYQIKAEAEGLILRTTSIEQSEETLISELNQLRDEYNELFLKSKAMKKTGKVYERNTFIDEILNLTKGNEAGEIIVDDVSTKAILEKNSQLPVRLYSGKENIFSAYRIEHEVEKALKRIVWLENGAYLIFDEAEALTVIDVNTGKFAGKSNYEETVLKTNEWAAVEVARQIRLRDIGGIILIDFIDMKEESSRKRIFHKIKEELSKDERRTNVIGFTPLGILQLTRKKTKPAILEALTDKCPTCEGSGRILSAETMAFRLERELWEYRINDSEAIHIHTTEEVARIFSGEQHVHKKRMEEIIGMKIIFTVIDTNMPFYEIRQFGEKAE